MEGLQREVGSGTDIAVEASWVDVKDPREKKKIQNRIAQRSYRQRMKARLENLQAKVNYHEQMSQGQLNLDGTPKDSSPQSNQGQRSPAVMESLTPKSPEREPQPVQQQTYYEHAVENNENDMYMQLPHPLNNGPQNHPVLPERTEQAVRPDYTGLPKQQMMVSEYLTPPRSAVSPQEESATMMNRHQLFIPEVNEVLDFNHSFDVWTSEMLAPPQRQNSYTTDPLATPPQHAQQPSMAGELPHVGGGGGSRSTTMASTSTIAGPLSSVSPMPSTEQQGLDHRFEEVLACTRAAGFESFDALVMAYYSGAFSESSPLAVEQRLSRNRGLPSVIANLVHNAGQWSDWERRGFHQELLRTTEAMLVSEGHDNHRAFESVLDQLDQQGDSQAIPALKRIVQNKLPNLWALMMALSAEHQNVWQRNRSNTVLAAIMLLRYPDHIPNDQLLKLVSGCS